MSVWGDPDSVSWARFPEAVKIGNALVLSFERPRPDLQNPSWKLHLAGDATLEGWQCDGNQITGWSPYAAASNMSTASGFVLELPVGALVQACPAVAFFIEDGPALW